MARTTPAQKPRGWARMTFIVQITSRPEAGLRFFGLRPWDAFMGRSIHGPQRCSATVFVVESWSPISRIFRQRLRDYQPQPNSPEAADQCRPRQPVNNDRNLGHQWGEMHPLSRARRREPPET